MSGPLNLASSLLSIACGFFFALSCFGYGKSDGLIKHFAWILSEDTANAYFGLRAVLYESSVWENAVSYRNDGSCTENWCDRCYTAGIASFLLLIFASVLSFLVAINIGNLIRSKSPPTQLWNALFASCIGILGIVSLSIFMGNCYDAIEDSSESIDSFDLTWGPGAALCFVAMVLIWIVAILQLAAGCM